MGATFVAMNKVRPGAYINFKAVPSPAIQVGNRGIATMGVVANWGEDNKLIEVYSTDLFDGGFEKKFGNTDRLPFELMLSGCYKALIYKLNNGGEKAKATIGTLIVTARYSGIFGNSISVGILENDSKFDVITYIGNVERDKQTVTTRAELKSNDFVMFSGTGTLTATVKTSLAGGSNASTNDYDGYFNLLKTANWQVLAVIAGATTANPKAEALIKNLREDNGKKVQAVLKSDTADYEGVIKTKQGFKTATADITADIFPAYVAGITAGAPVNKSNTARVVDGVVSIAGELTNEEIIKDLQKGYFLISPTSDGGVKCEQDINSLTTYGTDKDYQFSKNRIIRTIDEIANSITATFEKSYMGKVDANDIGLTCLKSDLISYFNSLQAISAIKNFTAEDVEVIQGSKLDEVVVKTNIMPVDSMEKMYMTVNLGGSN